LLEKRAYVALLDDDIRNGPILYPLLIRSREVLFYFRNEGNAVLKDLNNHLLGVVLVHLNRLLQ
jgi:hypothetical protein